MDNNNCWQHLTSGKFWASGSLMWQYGNDNSSKFINRDPKKDFDVTPQTYFGVWDLARLGNKEHEIFSDEFLNKTITQVSSLKPCLKHCMSNYLDTESQDFLIHAFLRARNQLKNHCLSEYFHAFAFLTLPGHSVGLHRHYVPSPLSPLSFTYVIRSNQGEVKTSYLKTMWEKGQLLNTIGVNFLDAQEFFMVHNSNIPHGAKTSPEDLNTYLYFIFDGVTPKDHIELDRFYESNI